MYSIYLLCISYSKCSVFIIMLCIINVRFLFCFYIVNVQFLFAFCIVNVQFLFVFLYCKCTVSWFHFLAPFLHVFLLGPILLGNNDKCAVYFLHNFCRYTCNTNLSYT